MKVIRVNTPKGQYDIPLLPVAEHRADYYACEVDGYEKGGNDYNEEVAWVMEDNFEAIDWLTNNSDWDDWESIAIKVNNKVKVTDDDFWTSSADFEILDNEKAN